jgi:hypothetical protein
MGQPKKQNVRPDKKEAVARFKEIGRLLGFENSLKDETIAKMLGFMDEQKVEVEQAGWVFVVDSFAAKIDREVRERAEDAKAGGNEVKQKLAKWVNSQFRSHGCMIAHPDDGEPCILLAINTKYGGKFVLENSKTKKRSCTTKDITELLPFKIIRIPEE